MLDWLLFEGCLKKIFIQMLGGGGIHYYLLSMLIPFVFHEGNKKADLAETPSKQRQILFMSYAVIVVLCVISAILFALKVFPYIPASKGGADFTNPVFVSVNLPDSTTLSAEQRNALSAPTSYVLIEETPESIFLAHIADAGGPLAWRQFAGVPKIVQIRKDAALIIQYHSQ